jgi:hypothetical protein
MTNVAKKKILLHHDYKLLQTLIGILQNLSAIAWNIFDIQSVIFMYLRGSYRNISQLQERFIEEFLAWLSLRYGCALLFLNPGIVF